MAQHGMARPCPAQPIKACHSPAWHSIAWHSIAQPYMGSAWHNLACQPHTAQVSSAKPSQAQPSKAWHSLAWHSLACHYMASHGTAQHSPQVWHPLPKLSLTDRPRPYHIGVLLQHPLIAIVLITSTWGATAVQPHQGSAPVVAGEAAVWGQRQEQCHQCAQPGCQGEGTGVWWDKGWHMVTMSAVCSCCAQGFRGSMNMGHSTVPPPGWCHCACAPCWAGQRGVPSAWYWDAQYGHQCGCPVLECTVASVGT